MRRAAFSLVELLSALAIAGVLAALAMSATAGLRETGQRAKCANSLRQLGVATHLYLAEHAQTFFAYSENTDAGKLWYFGLEPWGGTGAEGSRELDRTKAPLFPYTQAVGGIEVCPAFPYNSALWKPKFKGASYGYGFNTFLSGQRLVSLARPSQTILFGDCAQVNSFQPPASPDHPLLEEFYMIENRYQTIHFRHGVTANLLFVDGHVEAMKLWPGTGDTRLRGETVGRISPVGSMQYLQ